MPGPGNVAPRMVLFPGHGDVFFDPRPGRALRLSWHDDQGIAILSLWRDDSCAGTFRLPVAEVPDLVDALVRGLAAAAGSTPGKQPRAS